MEIEIHLPVNKDYQEILRLNQMLIDAEIPHVMEQYLDGWIVLYPGEPRICSVIEHQMSDGHLSDRLEISGLLNKEERRFGTTIGWLTAENVFDRIKRDWERRKKRDSKHRRT